MQEGFQIGLMFTGLSDNFYGDYLITDVDSLNTSSFFCPFGANAFSITDNEWLKDTGGFVWVPKGATDEFYSIGEKAVRRVIIRTNMISISDEWPLGMSGVDIDFQNMTLDWSQLGGDWVNFDCMGGGSASFIKVE
jgi:hypothetical protein